MDGKVSGRQSDRELLFGILSVQCGLVRAEQLVQAGAAWSTGRDQTLAAHLQRMGFLSTGDRAKIEQVVDLTVGAHGGDARQSLASFGGDRAVFESFGGAMSISPDGELDLVTASARAPEGPSTDLARGIHEPDDEAAVSLEHPGRYSLLDKDKLYGEEQRIHTDDVATAELGKGGMGRVLVAFDHHLGRDVAVKELLPDRASAGSPDTTPRSPGSPMARSGWMVARFLREARVTGQLEHPSIVPVYELGKRADGTLYYSMKLVRGRTLRDAIRECNSLADRLMLLSHIADLCHAVAYAHSRGVINRDIKPDNIMVGEFGETVVLDWGLAKVMGQEDVRGTDMVRDIQLVDAAAQGKTVAEFLGTPNYMPPEQAWGRLDEVDERSDIWSIGAVVYEVLTGRPPFEGVNALEVVGKVRSGEAPPVAALEPAAPAELAAVAARCLERDRARRYQSAREVAQEVELYQSGGRVRAYEYGSWELLRRFVAGNRALSAAVFAMLVILVISTGLIWQNYRAALKSEARARDSEAMARENEGRARRAEHEALSNLAEALVEKSSLAAVRRTWGHAFSYATRALAIEERPDARGELIALSSQGPFCVPSLFIPASPGKVHLLLFSPREDFLASADEGHLVRVWDVKTGRESARPVTHSGKLRALAWSPDGQNLASSGPGSNIMVSDRDGTRPVITLDSGTGTAAGLAFLADDDKLVSVDEDGLISFFDLATGTLLSGNARIQGKMLAVCSAGPGETPAVLNDRGELYSLTQEPHRTMVDGLARAGQGTLACSDSGNLFAAQDDVIVHWSLNEGRRLGRVGEVNSQSGLLSSSSDGKFLAVGSGSGNLEVYDTGNWNIAGRVTTGWTGITCAALSRCGTLLAAAGSNAGLAVWEVRSGKAAVHTGGHAGMVFAADFSSDGSLIATAGGAIEDDTRGAINIWDSHTGMLRYELTAGSPAILGVAFSPDSTALLTADHSGAVRLWDIESKAQLWSARHETGWAWTAAFSPDGRTVASVGKDGSVYLWQRSTGKLLRRMSPHGRAGYAVSFSPDGKRIVSCGEDLAVRVWSATSGDELLSLRGHSDWILDCVFSPDGLRIATSGEDETIRLWDSHTGLELRAMRGHRDDVIRIAYRPDGGLLASVGVDETLRLWEPSTGKELAVIPTFQGTLIGFAFSPDGRQVVTGGREGSIRTWDVPADLPASTPPKHAGGVQSLVVDRERGRLFSGGKDGRILVWGLESRAVETSLSTHDNWVTSLGLSADGRYLVSGGRDNRIVLWDANQGRELRWWEADGADETPVAISPNGKITAGAGFGNDIRVWETETGKQFTVLEGHKSQVGGLVFAGDGSWLASGSWDRTVRLWDTRSLGQYHVLEGHTGPVLCLARSRDSRYLASAGADKTIRIWDVQTRRLYRVLRGHAQHIWGLDFSSDNALLASASFDGSARIWAMDGAEKARIIHNQGAVKAVRFLDGSTVLVSGGGADTIRFWDYSDLDTPGAVVEKRYMALFGLHRDGTGLAPAPLPQRARLYSP